MSNTFSPPTLVDLQKLWVANGGKPLGIKGDAKHLHRGVSYHLGKDDLSEDAYSRQSKRDKAGLTNAASAIDLGPLNGSLENLRAFSRWLVLECQRDPKMRKDIREIIYTAHGKRVQRYSGIDNKIHIGPGNGDLSHLHHTHISFFRDSEFRDKRDVFRGFFVTAWHPSVPVELQAVDPGARKTGLAIRRVDHEYGPDMDLGDVAVGLTRVGHAFGPPGADPNKDIDVGDLMVLINS